MIKDVVKDWAGGQGQGLEWQRNGKESEGSDSSKPRLYLLITDDVQPPSPPHLSPISSLISFLPSASTRCASDWSVWSDSHLEFEVHERVQLWGRDAWRETVCHSPHTHVHSHTHTHIHSRHSVAFTSRSPFQTPSYEQKKKEACKTRRTGWGLKICWRRNQQEKRRRRRRSSRYKINGRLFFSHADLLLEDMP